MRLFGLKKVVKRFEVVIVFLTFLLFPIPPVFAGTITYTYDNAGRLIRADYGGGKVIEYFYDNAGNLTQRIISTTKWAGDSNGDGRTTIDEVQKAINQFLVVSPVEPCNDLNRDGQVGINELQRVINAYLGV